MDTAEISKKVDLELFLMNEVKEVSRDTDTIKAFLSEMATNYDSLNRIFIEGKTQAHLSHKLNLNYADAWLEDLVISNSDAGGIQVSELGDNGYHMRICAAPSEEGRFEAVEVSDDNYFRDEPNAIRIVLNTPSDIHADITIRPGSRIYTIKSVDRNSAILLRDSHFWNELGQANGLRLEAAEPEYTGKKPVTPWYRAEDKTSGAVLTMGRRWRVDEINIDFKKPVSAERINELFGKIDTTKYANGNMYSSGTLKADVVKSFTIHAWTKNDSMLYVSQLLEVARQG